MCSDAPDTTAMNEAARANSEVAKEALAFYKQAYADQAPLRAQAAETAQKVSDAQLGAMEQNTAISKDYWDYQKTTFRPLEQGIVADAQNYGGEDQMAAERAKRTGDVEQAAASAMQAMQRNRARMGNPSDGRTASMENQLAMQTALGKATAAAASDRYIDTQKYARKMDAANLGRGLASSQATSAGVALNAGNSAAQTGQMPLTQAQNATQVAGQGFGTAIQGNASAGNIYGQAANIQGQDSGALGALGGVAGQFLGGSGFATLLSDKNAKKKVKPVSDEQALDAIEKTPVSTWKYKEGRGDGGEHTGPMAQHVKKTMGEKAAPGGKQIDLITMNGVTMAGVAALSRKVDKLAKMVEGAAA
jgi:hypothetical protein